MSRLLFLQNKEALLTSGDIFKSTPDVEPGQPGSDSGKIALVDINGSVIDITSNTKITEPFSVYQLNEDGESIIQSGLITADKVKRAKLSLFSPEVKQTTTLTSLPTTGNINLKLTRLDQGYKEKTFNFTIKAESTATNSATELEAAINAIDENDRFFTVSRSTTTLTFTGKNGYVSFVTQVYNDDDEQIGTIAAGNAPSRGIGTISHLREINQHMLGVRGQISRAWLPYNFKDYIGNMIGTAVSNANSDGTTGEISGYDLVQLSIDAGLDPSIGNQTYELTLAFPAAGNDAGDSILAANSITQTTLNGLFGLA